MMQEFDNRNKDIKIWIDGKLLNRDEAKISVFDSVVQGGDAVWEGIRVYDKKIFCFDEHL
ncbi:MAG: aminotransferase IV, partial [Flavobacteriales bacterium]|nr:aminotransferase IV [Flavobacteriales bacterium]